MASLNLWVAFPPVSPFSRVGRRQEIEKTQPTNHPQPTPPNPISDKIRKTFCFPRVPAAGYQAQFSSAGQSLGGAAKPTTPSGCGPLTCFLANSLFVLSLLGRAWLGAGGVLSNDWAESCPPPSYTYTTMISSGQLQRGTARQSKAAIKQSETQAFTAPAFWSIASYCQV